MREQAVYPDEFSRYLSTGQLLIGINDREMSLRGFEYLKKAFELSPSESVMRIIVSCLNLGHIKPRVYPYIEEYLKEFIANKDMYAKDDGYFQKLMAARMSAIYMSSRYKRKDPEKAKFYGEIAKEYTTEFKTKSEAAIW